MSIGKFLGWIRRVYNTAPNHLTIYGFGTVAVLAIIGILLDNFLPFTLWWNVLRALVSIPLAGAIFILGYAQAISSHAKKVEENPEWISYRHRYSPSWRRRISAIIGAILVVIAYASTNTPFYTMITAGILATALALFAFMRLTRKEKIDEEYGLPDSREVDYQRRFKELQEERAKVEAKAKADKAAKRKKALGLSSNDAEQDAEVPGEKY